MVHPTSVGLQLTPALTTSAPKAQGLLTSFKGLRPLSPQNLKLIPKMIPLVVNFNRRAVNERTTVRLH